MAVPTTDVSAHVQVIDNNGQEVFGERQANPTAYTQLARLKDIADGLTAIAGAVTIADGADVALGATTDAEVAAGDASEIAILKRLRTLSTALNALLAGGLPATLGQKAMAASLAVVLATDQSDIPISIADGDDVAKGATTDVEATGDGSEIAILKRVRTLLAGGLPATLGQKTKAASLGVTLSSDEDDVPITLAGETVELCAGSASIGKLGANSGVDIGDVDVKSIAAGETHLGEVGQAADFIEATVTRPANATQYAVDDVLADSTPNVVTLTDMARVDAGTGCIVKGVMITNTVQGTKAVVRLLIFDTIYTPVNDNAALTLPDGEAATLLGYIDFDVYQASALNVMYQKDVNIPFKTGAASKDLFALPVLKSTYTPVSGETFTFRLSVEQN
jgi:hypothetical protein